MKAALRSGLFLAVLALAIVFLQTCSLASVSISDRISMFVSSLNTDRSSTSQNLDPAIVSPTQGQWNTFFGTIYEPYSYSPAPNTSNPADVETYIIGTGSGGWNFLYKFVMVNIGSGSDDWRIHSLWINTGPWTQVF